MTDRISSDTLFSMTASSSRISKEDIETMCSHMVEIILGNLANGHSVNIKGLGTLVAERRKSVPSKVIKIRPAQNATSKVNRD